MDLMEDWLGPTIEHQLERVLCWKEQGSAGFPTTEKVAYEDDGSNLRVRLKKVESLQIIKFEVHEDPIKAILSDSYTSIQATFASSTVRAYISEYRKRITADTVGGIIGIAQYEVVATHLGPRQSSVTLLVQDLQFRGCQSSPTFGQPEPIQERQRVVQLVGQLRELKSVEALDTPKDSEKDELTSPSSNRSQTESPFVSGEHHGNDEHSVLASQVAFRSQMPQNKEPQSAVANDVQRNKNPYCPAKDARPGRDRYGPAANASRREKNTHEVLLGLLADNRKHGNLESPTDRLTRDLTKVGLVNAKPPLKPSEKHERAAQHSDSGQQLSPHRAAPHAMAADKLLVNECEESVEGLQHETSGMNGDEIRGIHPKVLEVTEVDTELSNIQEGRVRTRKSSNENARESNPQMTPVRKSQAVEEHKVHTQSSEDFSIRLPSANNIGEDLTNNPWNGITRIRRRDTRIRKDQQKLLEHEDSWFPPQPGRRGPVANIPIATLQGLNTAAEPIVGHTKSTEEQQDVSELEITGSQQSFPDTGSEPEQGLDEERLSGWSSSPLPSALDDQLPPDSSFEASVPPDRTSRKTYISDATAAEDEKKEMSSPAAPVAPVQSGSAEHRDHIQVGRLESCKASRSDTGVPSQTPTAQAKPFDGQDNVLKPRSFEVAADSEYFHTTPTKNQTNDVSELKTTVGLTNERNLDDNSSENYSLERILAAGGAGAAANDSVVPSIHSPVRRSESLGHSSEDDNLESQLPQALGGENAGSDLEQVYAPVSPPLLQPSAAFHQGMPTLQVKRTPYHPRGNLGVSPASDTSSALLLVEQDRGALDSIGNGLASNQSSLAEVVIPGTHRLHSDTNIAGNSPSQVGADGTGDDIVMYDGEAVANQQIRLGTDTPSDRAPKDSPFKSRSSGLGGPSVESKHALDGTPYSPVGKDKKHDKRKVIDMDQLLPFVTKRRKRLKPSPALKPPPALNFSQENQQTQEPSLNATRHRLECLASRKSHHHSNAAEGLLNVVSQEIVRDAAQRTANLPQGECTPMELDQLPSETVMHTTTSESITAEVGFALPEHKPQSRDYTPRNKSVELGDDLHLSLDNSSKRASPPAAQNAPSPAAIARRTTPMRHCNTYDTFKSSYPEYSGGFKHFSGMCLKISDLLQDQRREHRFLWDDFVIRQKTDYRDYLLDCADRGDDPILYEQFYKNHIDEPIYCKHVLTPTTLTEALASVEQTGKGLQSERGSRSPVKALGKGVSRVEASPHEPSPHMKATEVIDLTLAGPSSRRTPATDHASKRGRPLPWTKSAKADIDSLASGDNIQTPKSALTRDGSTPVQTPSRKPKGRKQTPKQQTPAQVRNNAVSSQSASQPMAIADNPRDGRKSPSPHETPESNRSTVVEWLGSSSSNTASLSIPDSPRPNREEEGDKEEERPFKKFTKAYASLKSVEGRMGAVDQDGILRARPRQLDVLGWKL